MGHRKGVFLGRYWYFAVWHSPEIRPVLFVVARLWNHFTDDKVDVQTCMKDDATEAGRESCANSLEDLDRGWILKEARGPCNFQDR